jgi:hypothetical protein
VSRLQQVRRRHERGQGLVEFVIVLPILIFLIMGIVQFTLLYQVKSLLDHAAFLAARAGALDHGQTGGVNGINQGFAAGLTPLFNHGTSVTDILTARAKAEIETLDPRITQITIVSPTPQMVNDFGIARLDGGRGKEIPNDSLQYRATTPGASSNVSIQDANLLKLQVTYCARLIVPIAAQAIYTMVNGMSGFWNPGNDTGGSMTRCALLNGGDYRIPITTTYLIRMQSSFQPS